jgi:ribosome biogenesis GTPase
VPVTIVLGKADSLVDELDAEAREFEAIYRDAGYDVLRLSSTTGDGVEEIREMLRGRTTLVAGNSGVGKSSLLNRLLDGVRLSIGEVSEKLGRGKHTTRTVELFRVLDGYVADTPGFSTLELTDFMLNDKDELKFCFPEFSEHFGQCRFNSCTHVNEPDCSVINAVKNGEISKSRHDSYVSMFEDLKKIKSWEINKK